METTQAPPVLASFDRAEHPWAAVLDAVPAERWDAPSPCEGWSARDVVVHVVTTERDFLAERGHPLAVAGPGTDEDPATAWHRHAAAVRELLADPAVGAGGYDGWFGPTTVGATFEQFYVWDLYAHRWDVARAAALDTTSGAATFSDAELALLEAGVTSFGPALHGDGICGPALEVPADADRTTRLLAELGRRA